MKEYRGCFIYFYFLIKELISFCYNKPGINSEVLKSVDSCLESDLV